MSNRPKPKAPRLPLIADVGIAQFAEIEPGMVVPDGVILEVDRDGLRYKTTMGWFSVEAVDNTCPILARVTDALLDQILARVAEMEAVRELQRVLSEAGEQKHGEAETR